MVFLTRLFLNRHQFDNVLTRHLRRSKLGDVALNQLARLQQFKRAKAGEFELAGGHHSILLLTGDNVNT